MVCLEHAAEHAADTEALDTGI